MFVALDDLVARSELLVVLILDANRLADVVGDLLIGAIAYHTRGLHGNTAKLAVIKRIRQRGKLSLEHSTWLGATKFNLLRWEPREVIG